MTVAVNDANGAVVETTQTGPSGTADVGVPVGGLVAMYPPEQNHARWMQAVLDPPEGSTVTFFSYADPPPQQPETQYDVAATGYPASSATIEVLTCWTHVTVPASLTGTTDVLADDDNCPPSDKNTVLVIAYDGADQPLAWGRVEVDANPGGVVAVPVVVDQTTFSPFTNTIAPIPGDAVHAGFVLSSVGDHPPLFLFTEGLPSPGPGAVWSFTFPDTPVGFYALEHIRIDDGTHERGSARQRWYDTLPSSAVFDPTTLAPVLVEPPDTSDPAHPAVSWNLGAGDTGDATVVTLNAQFPGFTPLHFEIHAPPEFGTTFRLPDVPTVVPHFALDGPAGPPTGWSGTVACLDDESASGWSEIYLFQGPLLGPYGLVTSSGKGE